MRIALVSDIKDNLILREIKDAVQCNRKFHRSEIGRKMASAHRNRVQNFLTQFFAIFP